MCRLLRHRYCRQNVYFERFTQGVEVTNLFVWNFYSEIIHASFNVLGSCHTTNLAGASGTNYPKLSDNSKQPGCAFLWDSAFVNNTSATNGKVLRGGGLKKRGIYLQHMLQYDSPTLQAQ